MTIQATTWRTVCAAAVVMCAGGTCRVPVAAARTGNVAPLELRLTAPRSTYMVGEPVLLQATLSNPAAGAVLAHGYVDPSYGYTRVLIAFDNSPFKIYRGPGWGLRDIIPRSRQLHSGESIPTPLLLLFNHRSDSANGLQDVLAFPTAGRYLVKAEFYGIGFAERIESPPIALDITEPEGVDREARERLKDEDVLYLLHTGSAKGADAVRQLEALVTSYPQSRYAGYATDALARQRNARERTPAATIRSDISGPPVAEVVEAVVQQWTTAINAEDFDAAMKHVSDEQQSKAMWRRGAKEQEHVAQALAKASAALGTFTLTTKSFRVEARAVAIEVTVTSAVQGTFDSFIKLRKDGDEQWRISQTGFPK